MYQRAYNDPVHSLIRTPQYASSSERQSSLHGDCYSARDRSSAGIDLLHGACRYRPPGQRSAAYVVLRPRGPGFSSKNASRCCAYTMAIVLATIASHTSRLPPNRYPMPCLP